MCVGTSAFPDNILVYSPTLEDHVEHLPVVLGLLCRHQCYAKVFKCSFAHDNIEFLGHVISKDGGASGVEKTQAILSWPTRTTPM